jgi:hypothetical protein
MALLLRLALSLAIIATTATTVQAAPGDPIVPEATRVDATFTNLGVTWTVSGDSNLNSTMTIRFRAKGTMSWRDGAQAVRAYPTIIVQGSPLNLDQWGASAMFLAPSTTYELELTLTDPDGGSEKRVVEGTTRSMPTASSTPTIRYVAPGNGGGTGTAGDPFRGLQAAADVAVPGDVFNIESGIYAPVTIQRSGEPDNPIVFRGPTDGEAIIDGGNTNRGIVTIGDTGGPLSWIIIENLSIRNGRWGVDAQHTQNILISNNKITDVGYGVLNRRDAANEKNQTVCDNIIIGRTAWPNTGIPGERGIDLRGTGNVACYNTVQYFGDCVSLQPFTGRSWGNDVYGNDISFCVDDGIEIDYNEANVRVWNNRVTNTRMGVSLQPIAGGPAYIFRNQLFNTQSEPIKMHNQTTGFIIAQNTGVKTGNGYGDAGAMWRNATLRNNAFLGTEYAFEFTTTPDEGFRDFDYNAWGSTRVNPPLFKWNNVRYDSVSDLPAGVEDNGISIGFADLVNATLPSNWNVAAATYDLTPLATSDVVDAGTPLRNLNDGTVLNGAPDIGAIERGAAPPSYGPRTNTPGGRFIDVPGDNVFFDSIEWLAERGITKGCNPPVNDRYCPSSLVTRGQMATFLVRAFSLDAGSGSSFADTAGSVHVAAIGSLAEAGITRGCNPPANDRFCPDSPITRAQMATFLTRVLNLPSGDPNRFLDTSGSVHVAAIGSLAEAGITRGCNPPANDRFCPESPVTREQMAAFLQRAIQLP